MKEQIKHQNCSESFNNYSTYLADLKDIHFSLEKGTLNDVEVVLSEERKFKKKHFKFIRFFRRTKINSFLIMMVISSFILFVSCENNEPFTVESLKSQLSNLKQLGTLEYDLSKILIVDDSQWYSIGERKALISLKANLVAGIDFEKIEILNFKENKYIRIRLPEPEIILLNIPPDKIEFSVLKTSYMRSEFSNKELNDIQVLGEKDILEKIKDLGILEEAEKNAKLFLDNWVKLLGFEDIYYESQLNRDDSKQKQLIIIDSISKDVGNSDQTENQTFLDNAKLTLDSLLD
jgi:hypothetical protein